MRRHISSRKVELARLLANDSYDYIESLRRVREENGLTPREVADKLGVSEDAIHEIEAPDANPDLNTLRQYALAIGARVEHRVENYENDEAAPNQQGQHLRTNILLSYNLSEAHRLLPVEASEVSYTVEENIDEGTTV